jgi:NAD(P)-dependent dehydrogenase (short-subunit alcohol dehydrogenase family)
MTEDFNGKVVLVTGAGSGIGREAARAFSSRGAYVYAADVNEHGLAETEDLIVRAGGKAATARVDVASEEDVSTFLARIERDAGRLDAAFNNAGIMGGSVASSCRDRPVSL